MKTDRKQIPFRYFESLEKDFEVLFKFQIWGAKKNEAITDAIQMTAELSRVLENFDKEDNYYKSNKTKMYNLIEKLKKISKLPGKKDIINLDLKK